MDSLCYSCGKQKHTSYSDCKARGHTCAKCKQKNHAEEVCFSSLVQAKVVAPRSAQDHASEMEEESEDDEKPAATSNRSAKVKLTGDIGLNQATPKINLHTIYGKQRFRICGIPGTGMTRSIISRKFCSNADRRQPRSSTKRADHNHQWGQNQL